MAMSGVLQRVAWVSLLFAACSERSERPPEGASREAELSVSGDGSTRESAGLSQPAALGDGSKLPGGGDLAGPPIVGAKLPGSGDLSDPTTVGPKRSESESGSRPSVSRTATVAAVGSSQPGLPSSTAAAGLGVWPQAPRRAPRWVRKEVVEAGFVFGVGRVRGVENRALARMTAENRARADVIRQLGVGEGEGVSGIDIVDHWTDPRSGSMFARARFKVGPTAE